jgi:hypothetical protein
MTKQKETSEEEVRYEGSVVFQPISGLVRHLIDEISKSQLLGTFLSLAS